MQNQIKQTIEHYFCRLSFEEKSHKYFIGKTPVKYSVSGVIKNFYKPFDVKTISERVALSEGVSGQEIRDRWTQIGKEACEKGTEVHLFGEDLQNNLNVSVPIYLKKLEPKKHAVFKFWESLPDFIVPVIAECRMYHKSLKFAGTADIILLDTRDNSLIICDYKTNKDLFKNYKGQRLLEPFKNKLDNPFHKYEIQLSLYQILLEQVPNVKVSKRRIIWLLEDGKYVMYDCEDLTIKLKKVLPTLNLK